MPLPEISCCPGTLASGFETYSRTCLNKLFDGKKVSHILPYFPPNQNEEDAEKFIANRKRISISGFQEKVSFTLEKNHLRLTNEGETGRYILKPIPNGFKKVNQVPANEHLTMQIALQVYKIQAAQNALVFFKNGEPAYITKRFDVKKDGTKWGKEDFATLAGKTSETDGPDFKYNYSYQGIASLLKRYVGAYKIEAEKLFQIIVFNYLFSNGDAHLKNFSLLESSKGDYLLSPAYDLINTRLHIDDSDFALSDGLFADDYQSDVCRKRGHPAYDDFFELGKRMEILPKRLEKLLQPFCTKQGQVEILIENSFLDKKSKRAYLLHYQTRKNWLNAS